MNITLAVDDEVIESARQRAKVLGSSVNQLVREYLEQLAGKRDPKAGAAEFEKLSRLASGNSHGWKFGTNSTSGDEPTMRPLRRNESARFLLSWNTSNGTRW